MPNRRWPKDLFRAALFCAALLLIALAVNWWAGYRECYDALRVGMPRPEARVLMERHGYTTVHIEESELISELVYSRGKAEPPIRIAFNRHGVLTDKKRRSWLDHLLISFGNRIRGLRAD